MFCESTVIGVNNKEIHLLFTYAYRFWMNKGDKVNGEVSNNSPGLAAVSDPATRLVQHVRFHGGLGHRHSPALQLVLSMDLVPQADDLDLPVRLDQHVHRQGRHAV